MKHCLSDALREKADREEATGAKKHKFSQLKALAVTTYREVAAQVGLDVAGVRRRVEAAETPQQITEEAQAALEDTAAEHLYAVLGNLKLPQFFTADDKKYFRKTGIWKAFSRLVKDAGGEYVAMASRVNGQVWVYTTEPPLYPRAGEPRLEIPTELNRENKETGDSVWVMPLGTYLQDYIAENRKDSQ